MDAIRLVRDLKLQEPWPHRRLGEVTLTRKGYHQPSDENPADERLAKARARSMRILAFPRQRESQAEEVRMRTGWAWTENRSRRGSISQAWGGALTPIFIPSSLACLRCASNRGVKSSEGDTGKE